VIVLVILAFAAQAAAMFVDEWTFHRRRRLPRWERIGHPLDTTTVLACYAWLLLAPQSSTNAVVYVALVMCSSLFVTKDERVHAEHCTVGEQWVHALLFVLHPIVLFGAGWVWWTHRFHPVLIGQLVLTAAFGLYQVLYWNRPWRHAR
jgi:hypothetical protein